MKKRNFLWLLALPFMLTACQAGPTGPQGEKGETGQAGSDGVSVVSIAKTSSEGNKDTYTITYSNGTTSTFIVTNGTDGSQGIQGIPGKEGHSPVISIGSNGNWYVDGADTGMKAQGPKGDKGNKGDKGEDAITYIPCIFNNYDGTKLYEFYYEKGTDIVYDGPTPTKTTIEEDGSILNWSFTGWDKSLVCIQKPTIFTAQFKCLYTCTFVNYDGLVLDTKIVGRGEDAVYDGPVPTKPSEISGDQKIEWRFSGWDKSLDDIKCDTIFTAQFDAPNAIKLTFFNYDGILLFTQYCGVNATVKYAGPTPTKPQEADGTTVTEYTFSEWDKPLSNISTPTDFHPTFTNRTFTGYKVTFMDAGGDRELYSHYFEEGTAATYPYETPWSYDDTSVTMFFGWSEPISSITKATTVTMRVRTIDRAQNGEYPQTKATDPNVIAALDELPRPSDGSYLQYDGKKYEPVGSNYYKVEPIRWRYLGQDGDAALLLSERVLDVKRYNEKWSGTNGHGYYANNYKRSEIRDWLNGEFYEKAFSDPSLIATTAVDNSVSSTGSSYNPYVCETTNDKVFLLSRKEVTSQEFGFGSDQTRVAFGTEYANGYEEASSWWLRSPQYYYSTHATCVRYYGDFAAYDVDYSSYCGIRPAIRINLD